MRKYTMQYVQMSIVDRNIDQPSPPLTIRLLPLLDQDEILVITQAHR